MTEAEADEIAVEVRLSDEALARRISVWLDESGIFVTGAAKGGLSVMIADHIPDDAEGPLILLAGEDELLAWPRDRRVAARLKPDAGLVKLRIAVEAAAHGFSINETARGLLLDAESTALTSRELEVLRHLVDGAPNKAIARALGISPHTVKFHVRAILEKLGATTRTEAAMHAVRLGLCLF